MSIRSIENMALVFPLAVLDITDKDEESLFCDGDFLEELLQKPIERIGKERATA